MAPMSPEALRAASISFANAAQTPEAGGENTKPHESRFGQQAPTRAAALAMRFTRTSASQPPPPQPPPKFPCHHRKLQKTLRPHRLEPLPPSITARQAGRYTRLFVTNRGFLCEQEDLIHNYTTRELWQRSRLPDRVLEQVWAYVDTGGKGALTREEFALGMWLVDGCLAGRKVPSAVNSSHTSIE